MDESPSWHKHCINFKVVCFKSYLPHENGYNYCKLITCTILSNSDFTHMVFNAKLSCLSFGSLTIVSLRSNNKRIQCLNNSVSNEETKRLAKKNRLIHYHSWRLQQPFLRKGQILQKIGEDIAALDTNQLNIIDTCRLLPWWFRW